MVFWGIEVKPGKPFTLPDNRRLHLSQATLGVGSAISKSIVQCNVGDKTPLFLCSLVPEKMECCPLNLKYEEADDVVFSVIGSRSVHLTGYFDENSTSIPNNDDDDKTESFGEDIPDTETERSESEDDDEYGGSFIDDGDIEVFPASPSAEVARTSRRKKCRKLKKCRIVESDNDDCSPVTATSKVALPVGDVDRTSNKKDDTKLMKYRGSEPNCSKKNNDNCSPVKAGPQMFGIFDVSDSEDEDAMPIGTRLKHHREFESLRIGSVGDKMVNANSKNSLTEDESRTLILFPDGDLAALKPKSRDADMESVLESKNVRLKDSVDNGNSLVDNKTDGADAGESLQGTSENDVKIDHKSHHPEVAEGSLENSIDGFLQGFTHTLPLSAQLGCDDDGQDGQGKEKRQKTAEDCFKDVSNEVDKALKNEKLDSDASQQKERKKKKRKKSNIKDVKKRTLPNGVVVEEQEIGNPDGKIAMMEKTVTVRYVVKSLESGQVLFNPDPVPVKYKLGAEGQDDWLLGIEGMRVGGRRSISVPPSLGTLLTEGASSAANPWLVYEVELVKVR